MIRHLTRVDRARTVAGASLLGLACASAPILLSHSAGSHIPHFDSGSAWLVSDSVGLLTKADGASARPVAQLQLPSQGTSGPFSVSQQGGKIVLWSAKGETWSVDDAKEAFGDEPLADSGISTALISGSQIYGLSSSSPDTIRSLPGGAIVATPRNTVEVGSHIYSSIPGQGGSLWVSTATSGQLLEIKGTQIIARKRVSGVSGSLLLTSAENGTVSAIDTGDLRLMVLRPGGQSRSFPISTSDRQEVKVDAGAPSGSSSGYVPLVLEPTQTLLVIQTATGRSTAIPLRLPAADQLGRPVASDGLVYVPNDTTGTVLVADISTDRIMRSVRLADGAAQLDVFEQDGMVWANDPSGPRAMVAYQGSIRVFMKYSQASAAASTASAPAKRPSPTATPKPTPTPTGGAGKSPPVHPAPSPSPSGSRPTGSASGKTSAPPQPQPTPSGPDGGSGSGSTPQLLKTLAAGPGAGAVFAWDPAAPMLLTADGPASGQMWNVADPQNPERLYPVADPGAGYIGGADFAAQGGLLFVAGRASGVGMQQLTIYRASGTQTPEQLYTGQIGSQDRGIWGFVAVRPDGGAFALEGGGDAAGGVAVEDSTNPSSPEALDEPGLVSIYSILVKVMGIIFSPDGTTIAASSFNGTSSTTTLYLIDATDLSAAKIVSATKVTGDSVLAFSPDSSMLLAPGIGAPAALWDVRNHAAPTQIATVPAASDISSATFDSSGSLLVTGEKDGTVQLWKVSLGRPTLLRTLTKATSEITQVSFDSRTGLLGVADGSSVEIWKLN